MRRPAAWAAILLALGTACAGPRAGGADRRPNIVFFIADDMAWDDCAPYGNDHVRAPTITRLAREGMRFTRAYLTASSCSPSRSSIITSRYPHQTGAEELHWPLPASQVTFVEKLKAAGYWTGAAGKWHLGDAVKDRFDEIREADPRGFSLPTGKEAKGAVLRAKGDQSGCAEWVGLLRNRPRDRPFFLWLASLDPHRAYEENIIPHPQDPAGVVVPPYLPDVPEVRKELAFYYDEITRLDDFMGRVLKELERQGVADNTVVLFISDNGRPFPRCKCTLYDAGIRTPWIVRWPGVVKPGSTSDSLVSSVDIGPTFLDIAGLPSGKSFMGKSFKGVLTDPTRTVRRFAYAERSWHDYADHVRAVTDGRFKYMRNAWVDMPNTPPADVVRSISYRAMQRLRDGKGLTAPQMGCFTMPRPKEELYDMKSDPEEFRNLAADPAYADRLAEMRRVMDAWVEETGDFVPADRSADEFDRETGAPLPNRIRPRVPRVKKPRR